MPRSSITLALSDAKRMLEAGEAKAASIGIAYNIAVVDAGGALVAFTRQDGALIGSIDLAISKAITARLFDKRTSDLARMAQPGAPLFGIEQSNSGKVVIFGGGLCPGQRHDRWSGRRERGDSRTGYRGRRGGRRRPSAKPEL